jgi:hypothetical protein
MMVTLDKVIRDSCERDGDTDYKYYMRNMRLANAAIRNLSIMIVPIYKSIVVEIDSTRIVTMPSDFVRYTKVGICRNGRIVTLSLDNELCKNEKACDCSTKDEADEQIDAIASGTLTPTFGYPFFGYDGGYPIGELYGMSGGYNIHGFYKFDKANNRFMFHGVREGEKVIIEYKSNGVGDGASAVPTEAEEAIVNFILWKSNEKTNPSFSDRCYRNYKIQYEQLRKIYGSFTESEWRDSNYRGIKSTVKR